MGGAKERRCHKAPNRLSAEGSSGGLRMVPAQVAQAVVQVALKDSGGVAFRLAVPDQEQAPYASGSVRTRSRKRVSITAVAPQIRSSPYW